MRASALIWGRKVPILGVNTYPTMFEGALNNHSIKYEKREIETEAMLEAMEDDLSVQFEKRSRILFEKVK